MTNGRWTATTVLALALVTGGCSADDGGTEAGNGPAASPTASVSSAGSAATTADADDAASAYRRDLKRYQRAVERAAARSASWVEGDSTAEWRAAERAFAAALDEAPELEVVDGGAEASDAYARVLQVAEHAQGFVDEHLWMSRWGWREIRGHHGVLTGMVSERFSEDMRMVSEWERIVEGPGDPSANVQKALQKQVATQLENLEADRREVEDLAGKDSFTPSLRDHILNQVDEVTALGERYAEYVETVPAEALERDLFRNGFAGGSAVPDAPASQAPAYQRVASRKLLAEGLSGLVKAADGGQRALPTAGDIYREIILRLFIPSRADRDDRRSTVDQQLYWLWHIREIEDTPDEAYDDARLTIKLQLQGPSGLVRVNIDSRFDELAAMYAAWAGILRDPESMAANKLWIIELLARPYPEVLGKAVGLAREAADLMSDDGSPASAELLALGPRLGKALGRAADALDDTRRFRRDFRRAINGTRPAATA